ncbi:hypothetical protein QBC43DRAFT_283406 [Cladorrhinum sp. PSN259]|nr:hypothetical protein QBC43DRAFT_283406 [Cladorrhinum sp. PSN259]
MTSTVARHDVFNASSKSSSSYDFPNDFSSKNALEKLAQAEAVEAAKKKKIEDEAAELSRFRTAYPTLEAQKKLLETRNFALESEKKTLEAQKATAESEKKQKEAEIATLKLQMGEMENQLFQFRQDIDLMKIRLNQPDSRYNLEHSYHDKPVMIRLACWPHTALDFGAPHGWEYNTTFQWQWLRLRRVDGQNNNSAWTITNDNGELFLAVSDDGTKIETQRGRRQSTRQEWWIGMNAAKTGYRIESIPCQWLQMEEPKENKNGKKLSNAGSNENNPGQIWHIIIRK